MVDVEGALPQGSAEDEDDVRHYLNIVKECRRSFRRFDDKIVKHDNDQEVQSMEISLRMPGSSEETTYR